MMLDSGARSESIRCQGGRLRRVHAVTHRVCLGAALGALFALFLSGHQDALARARLEAASSDPQAPLLLDDFEDPSIWSAHPADGVSLSIGSDQGIHGRALRLDFSFHGGGGYAVARRPLALNLPDNYAFVFRLRGVAPSNHLEFKLIDESGENVWWHVHRDMAFPEEWRLLRIKKRQIGFAWGPAGGGEMRRVAALEIAVTAGSGGSGTVWLDDLQLQPLPPADRPLPEPMVLSSSGENAPATLDRDPATAWTPATADTAPWIEIDLGAVREFGGLVLDWLPGRHAPDYRVEVLDPIPDSVEGSERWNLLRAVHGGNGGRDYLFLPESETSRVRIRLGPADGETEGETECRTEGGGERSDPAEVEPGEGVSADLPALAEISVQPLEWSATRESFFRALALDAPRGLYPRGIRGEPSFWTVAGVDRDPREGVFSQDGALDAGWGSLSIEPFLRRDGRLLTWADVQARQSLDSGCLPIPSVTWLAGPGRIGSDEAWADEAWADEAWADSARPDTLLKVTGLGAGPPGSSFLAARYTVYNPGPTATETVLYLALRPFQAYPPSQFLNRTGGCAEVRGITRTGPKILVESGEPAGPGGRGESRIVTCLTEPDAFGAATFDQGDAAADFLAVGAVPGAWSVTDPFQAASAVLVYNLDIPPGESREVDLLVSLYGGESGGSAGKGASRGPDDPEPEVSFPTLLDQARRDWAGRVGEVEFRIPEEAAPYLESVRAQLAYILVNRAGAAIQPGPRAYARSWIRDGALTSEALLRLGLADEAAQFLEWFAPNQYDNGKIPCVVDFRGADPVPEHDSSGEFIHLAAEVWRYAGDRDLLERMWPRVQRAAGYLDSLRRERRTEEYRIPENAHFFGLLPPSISHEGYSAKPMHSYWDDFWALRGFKDAVYLAGVLGRDAEEARLESILREFSGDLSRSIQAAMQVHGIDYIPGAADLGDFDPTSTTIALAPAAAESLLPTGALERTFQRYWEFFQARAGGEPWEAYTPYELRSVGAFVRLGRRDRAWAALEFFLQGQTPPGWRQWPEVVWNDPPEARFVGDIPHTWVGSDFLRSFLDLFAFEREADQSLVLAAGIPQAWLDGREEVGISRLRTPYGPLGFSLRKTAGGLELKIEPGSAVPPGGLVLRPPMPGVPRRLYIDGEPAALSPAGEMVVRRTPAAVRVEF